MICFLGVIPLPPIVAESSAMELQRRVAVITSAVCSAVVLVVILIAACAVLTRRRRHRPEAHDSGGMYTNYHVFNNYKNTEYICCSPDVGNHAPTDALAFTPALSCTCEASAYLPV